MSDHVGSVMTELGVVENVGVAVEISFVVVTQAEIICIYADFKAFPVFRSPYLGKVAKARPLIPTGVHGVRVK